MQLLSAVKHAQSQGKIQTQFEYCSNNDTENYIQFSNKKCAQIDQVGPNDQIIDKDSYALPRDALRKMCASYAAPLNSGLRRGTGWTQAVANCLKHNFPLNTFNRNLFIYLFYYFIFYHSKLAIVPAHTQLNFCSSCGS